MAKDENLFETYCSKNLVNDASGFLQLAEDSLNGAYQAMLKGDTAVADSFSQLAIAANLSYLNEKIFIDEELIVEVMTDRNSPLSVETH